MNKELNKELLDDITASVVEGVEDFVHAIQAGEQTNEDEIRKWMETWVAYAEAGPSFDPKGKYQCGTCAVRIDPDRCAPVSGKINFTTGSCRLYVHGPDRKEKTSYAHQLTQIESQYGERPKTKAFGCARCVYVSRAKESDSNGRGEWCSYFGVHVQPLACCAMNEGKDSVTPKEVDAGGPGSGRHKEGIDLYKTNVFNHLPVDWPITNDRYRKLLKDNAENSHIEISKLIPTQENLEREGIDRHKGVNLETDRPEVLLRGGKYYIADGHHRIALALEEGKTSVPIKLVTAAAETSLSGQFDGSLWNGIKLTGFTGPEEEELRAMLSRVPPELLFNVKEFKSADELQAVHGTFFPSTKTIAFNPANFRNTQKFGKGDGWLHHSEMTVIHEVGHSLFDTLTAGERMDWNSIFGWRKGFHPGQAMPFVETRKGWDAYKSEWTHKAGVTMPRYYSAKTPNECFADCFAYFILGKAHQMELSAKKFLEKFIQDRVHRYPKVSIESPTIPAVSTTKNIYALPV